MPTFVIAFGKVLFAVLNIYYSNCISFLKIKIKIHYILIRVFVFFFGWQIFALWHKRRRNYFNINSKKFAIVLEKITKFSKPQKKKHKTKQKTLMSLRMCFECTMAMLFTLKKY